MQDCTTLFVVCRLQQREFSNTPTLPKRSLILFDPRRLTYRVQTFAEHRVLAVISQPEIYPTFSIAPPSVTHYFFMYVAPSAVWNNVVLSYSYNSKHSIFGYGDVSFSRLECGIHDRLHIYFPWHRHQIEGADDL